MSNSKSSTSMCHFLIDTTNRNEKVQHLLDLLDADNDLTENEDFFQADTLELGYDNEAERIVKEYLKDNPIDTNAQFIDAMETVFSHISDQEYFGICEMEFVEINEQTLSCAYYIGGEESY